MLSDTEFNKIFSKTGFASARPQQRYAIEKAIDAYNSGKRYVIINAPTRIGKSGISYAIANYFGTAYFLTVQRILQEQYKHDFNMPTISSKKNYWCRRMFDCRCSTCMQKIVKSRPCGDCPYLNAYKTAFTSDFCSPNYSYMLAISGAAGGGDLPQGIETRHLVVCDECHQLEAELISRGTCEIDANIEYKMQHLVKSHNTLDLPPFSRMTDNELLEFLLVDYQQFVNRKIFEVNERLELIKKIPKGGRSLDELKKLTSVHTYYTEKCCHLTDMQKYAYPDVVVNNNKSSFSVKPLFASGFFHSLLTRFGSRFLFMSATILDKARFCKEIGLPADECEYIELDSEFPIENRPIYFWPSGSLAYKDKHATFPRLCSDVEEILKKYSDDKGIIHCVNYEISKVLQNSLMSSSQFNRLIFVTAENKQEELEKFKTSQYPYVLVSPSLSEGLDLKDDLSRFCIICKVPYASLADNWIKKKIEVDKGWYELRTAETLIQQTGRSIRSKTDHADTYILDSQFLQFYNRNNRLFPKYWKDSISFV